MKMGALQVTETTVLGADDVSALASYNSKLFVQ